MTQRPARDKGPMWPVSRPQLAPPAAASLPMLTGAAFVTRPCPVCLSSASWRAWEDGARGQETVVLWGIHFRVLGPEGYAWGPFRTPRGQ